MQETIIVRLHDPSMSHAEVAAAIERVLNPRSDTGNGAMVESYGRGWKWTREIWDDKVIYEDNGRQYQATYTMDANGEVELGEPTEVMSKMIYVKAAEETTEEPSYDSMKTFLSRLRDNLRGAVDGEAWTKAIASARGHAGGKAPRKPSSAAEYAPDDDAIDGLVSAFLSDHPDLDDDTDGLAGLVEWLKTSEDLDDDDAAQFAQGGTSALIKTFGKWARGKHSVCVRKLSGKVDDPDALCAWLEDRYRGNTKWRGKSQGATETIVASGRMVGPTATTVLFNELAFAEAPEWIPFLPKPGTYSHPKYGEIKITKKRAGKFVKQFQDAVYQDRLPIDAEHQTKLSGALGWITDMRVNDDGSVDAKSEWTERGTTLMADNRFKYFSPEWFEKWTDPATDTVFTDVAIGGALTTRPFFKHGSLRPLVAAEGRVYGASDDFTAPDDDSGVSVEFEVFAFAEADDREDEDDMPEGENTRTLTEEQYQELLALPAKFAESEAARTAAEEQLRSASERLATLTTERRRDRVTAIVTGKTDDAPRPFVGETEKHVSFMEHILDTVEGGEESDQFQFYVTQQRAYAEVAESQLFREVGSGQGNGASGSDAWSQITSMAEVLVKEDPDLTLDAARERVMEQHPTLAAQA